MREFVNADIIAKGLSDFRPESVAFDAGSIMLQHRTRAEAALEGGHHVPEDVIRWRYEAGLKNFFRIYRPLARRSALGRQRRRASS